MSEPVAVDLKVAITPVQRLEQLSLLPDVPRAQLRDAIADLVLDITERLAELESQAAERHRRPLADPRRGLPRTLDGLRPRPR